MNLPNNSSPLTNPFHSEEDEMWIQSIAKRYEFEDRLTTAVRQGQTAVAMEILQGRAIVWPEAFSYLPMEKLEIARQGCRIMNIICRIAARSGGLPPLYVHNISEKFGLIINSCRDIEQLRDALIRRIVKNYAEAVAEFSTSSYSPLIAGAVSYINEHITAPLEVSGIAAKLFVSTEHLSRRFKQETGKTINSYIHHQRIALAKVLFAQGNSNVAEVAARAGYHDSSHFSRNFKKICGISPKEYITNM